MSGFIHDITAMGAADWLRLGGLLVELAVVYALGMEAGRAKATRNGGVGWLGFAIVAFFIGISQIASHSGTPIPPWWSSVAGYGD
jgi:hypothetical protein